MAQAVVSVLDGDRSGADALFFRAEALLRARRDSVRVRKLANLRATLGMGGEPWADVTVEDWLSRGQYWRAALALARTNTAVAKDRARILAELAGVAWEELVVTHPEQEPVAASSAASPPGRKLRTVGARRVLVTPDGREIEADRTSRRPGQKLLREEEHRAQVVPSSERRSCEFLRMALWRGCSSGAKAGTGTFGAHSGEGEGTSCTGVPFECLRGLAAARA
jgi:hypothetical protein